jgi:hypothetical protein
MQLQARYGAFNLIFVEIFICSVTGFHNSEISRKRVSEEELLSVKETRKNIPKRSKKLPLISENIPV